MTTSFMRSAGDVLRAPKLNCTRRVFEEHLPNLTPIYSTLIRPGSLVARRGAVLTDVWRVLCASR